MVRPALAYPNMLSISIVHKGFCRQLRGKGFVGLSVQSHRLTRIRFQPGKDKRFEIVRIQQVQP